MLTVEQQKAVRERATERAKRSLSLIREKLPEASIVPSGERIGLRTNFAGKELGVTYFAPEKLLEEDYVRTVVTSWEGKVNERHAQIVAREAILEAILELLE